MLPLSAVIFFTSGFAALLYQVIWQRLLVLFSGADLYSVTIIVASFMGGMGVGHLAGGHVADRVNASCCAALLRGRRARDCALSGSSAALFTTTSCTTASATRRFGAAAQALLLFASLLWPTFFMGASLPLLSRALASRIRARLDRHWRAVRLNTLGAATGALLFDVGIPAAPWPRGEPPHRRGAQRRLRPRSASFRGAPFAIARAGRRAARRPAARRPHDVSVRCLAVIFACSGLLRAVARIVWFRVLAVTMKGTAFTFGTMLGVYLTGLGVGALAGSAVSSRIPRPAIVFLLLQAAVGAVAMLLLTAFIRFADNMPSLWAYLGSYEPLDIRSAISSRPDQQVWRMFVALYVGLPCVLVLPPTLLMGFSFPILQRVVQTSLARIGRRVGVLLVANVAGSMVGTVLTGWLLLDRVGTAGTMKLLAILAGIFGVLAVVLALRPSSSSWTWSRRMPAAPAALLVTSVVFVPLLVVMPPSNTLWAHLHGTVVEAMEYVEDGSGLSVVNTDGRNAILYANGIGQGALPYGDVHTALAPCRPSSTRPRARPR